MLYVSLNIFIFKYFMCIVLFPNTGDLKVKQTFKANFIANRVAVENKEEINQKFISFT